MRDLGGLEVGRRITTGKVCGEYNLNGLIIASDQRGYGYSGYAGRWCLQMPSVLTDGLIWSSRQSMAASRRREHGACIRRLTADDIEPVQALLHRTWITAYGEIFGAEGAEAYSRWVHCTSFMRHWSRPLRRHCVLVAEVDDEIIGFACARLSVSGTLHIHEVYIDQKWQGNGIGTRLIAACAAKYPGARRHEIEVLAANPRAGALYRRLGFEQFGTRRDVLHPRQVVLRLRRNRQFGCGYGLFDRIRIQLARDE